MSVNKVVYGTTTLVDLTSDTVVAGAMLSGYTAHSKSGDSVTGTIATNSKSGTTTLTASSNSVTLDSGYYSGSNTIEVDVYDGTIA